jgi:hypothetical protein
MSAMIQPASFRLKFKPALTAYGLAALEGECSAICAAPFGEQELTLNNAALEIGRLVAGGELDEEYTVSELIAAGNAMQSQPGKPPWTPGEVEYKVRHSFADGIRSPRAAPKADSVNDGWFDTGSQQMYYRRLCER